MEEIRHQNTGSSWHNQFKEKIMHQNCMKNKNSIYMYLPNQPNFRIWIPVRPFCEIKYQTFFMTH